MTGNRERHEDQKGSVQSGELIGAAPGWQLAGGVEQAGMPGGCPAGKQAGGQVALQVQREVLETVAGEDGQQILIGWTGH